MQNEVILYHLAKHELHISLSKSDICMIWDLFLGNNKKKVIQARLLLLIIGLYDRKSNFLLLLSLDV